MPICLTCGQLRRVADRASPPGWCARLRSGCRGSTSAFKLTAPNPCTQHWDSDLNPSSCRSSSGSGWITKRIRCSRNVVVRPTGNARVSTSERKAGRGPTIRNRLRAQSRCLRTIVPRRATSGARSDEQPGLGKPHPSRYRLPHPTLVWTSQSNSPNGSARTRPGDRHGRMGARWRSISSSWTAVRSLRSRERTPRHRWQTTSNWKSSSPS